MSLLTLLFAVLMSIPFLVPHCGFVALFGFVPLLCMDRIADMTGQKKVWRWHYSAFVLWNLFTTFWVCNATVGGGIFAALANALQMSLIFGLFRWSKKYFKGALAYIFLALAWIAWEKYYLCSAQISWPWLVLGNSFARSVASVQWYETTGTMGGTIWIWATNLSLFGIMVALSDGSWSQKWNGKARLGAVAGYLLLLVGPMVYSRVIYDHYQETSDPLDVVIAQPNIDPYHKFTAMSQQQQNAILLSELDTALTDTVKPILAIAPETFTNDIVTNEVVTSPTFRRFVSFLGNHHNVNLLFGASTYDIISSAKAPSKTARPYHDGMWVESHNSAFITDATGRYDMFHKSKLVVGVESTPYPGFFCKVDDLLGGVMGRDVGQEEISNLNFKTYSDSMTRVTNTIPVGCAICYESVYGEYCTGYVKAGAKLLAIITNDAWWGNTPGYRQHLSYARLRAIETRRDIARCGNTGISAIINQRGDIIKASPWWQTAVLKGQVNLNDRLTTFVASGDYLGRLCTFFFGLMALAFIVKLIIGKKQQ